MYGEYVIVAGSIALIWINVVMIERRVFRGSSAWQSNQTMFASTWFVGAVLLSLPIFKFPEIFNMSHGLYVILIHLTFAVGGICGLFVGGQGTSGLSSSAKPVLLTRNLMLIMLLLGVAGQFIKSYDAYLSGTFGFFERLDVSNLKSIKEDYVDPTRQSALSNSVIILATLMTGVGQVGLVGYSCVRAQALSWARRSQYLKLASGLFIFSMAFTAWFGDGSRLGLVLALLMAAVPYAIARRGTLHEKAEKKQKKLTTKRILLWSVLLGGGLFFSVVFLGGRIGGNDALRELQGTHRAAIDPAIRDLIAENGALKNLAFQLSYFTTGLTTLTYYLNASGWWPSQLGNGALTLGPFLALFGRFVGFDYSGMPALYAQLTVPVEYFRYFPNVWSTMTRELLMDFGYWGALVFFFCFGFIANRLRVLYFKTQSAEVGVLYTLVCIQLIWSGLHSLLNHQNFGYALLVSVLVCALVPFIPRSAPASALVVPKVAAR